MLAVVKVLNILMLGAKPGWWDRNAPKMQRRSIRKAERYLGP